jgi:hypothetical protein
MKSLTLKIRLIITLAVVVLVIGGIILLRQKPAWWQPEIQAKRYPHKHLPPSEWEPRAKLNADTYALHNGETLADVAVLRYGHQKYAGVIKLCNHIEDETHIEAGSNLHLPDMSAILAEEGVTKVAAGEVELILCSRAKYDKVVDQLLALRLHANGSYETPEPLKLELLEAADDLQTATENLKASKAGMSGVPKSMIGQLEQGMTGMRDLAWGNNADPNSYDIDMVQQRYALALAYAVIWAREGFK